MSTKAHTRYRLPDGTLVPGVTTVLGILSKPALIHWAWALGMKGEDYRKVRNKAADIGTIAHSLIECDIKKKEFDRSQYAPADIARAEMSYLAWLQWCDLHHLETIKSEIQLVSINHRFGGTLDWVVKNKTDIWLVDFKSSNAVYPEMRYQIAAYKLLWDENFPENRISQCHLIRLDKDQGNFEHHRFTDLSRESEIFLHCLAIYKLISKGEAYGG